MPKPGDRNYKDPPEPKRAKPRIRALERYSPEWEREANRLARDYAPSIYACAHCTHPVAKGYCCQTCGSADPEGFEMRQRVRDTAKRIGVKQ